MNIFSTAVPLLFTWPDMTLSPLYERNALEKSGRSLNGQVATLFPGPTSLRSAPSSCCTPCCDVGSSLCLPLATPLQPQQSSPTTSKVYFRCLPFLKPSPKDKHSCQHTQNFLPDQGYPSMIPTFEVDGINTPWQNFDQLELEQNCTS